jgi:hypothetical protein
MAPKRRNGSSGKTARAQFHLGERTLERLAVHCALVHRNQSAMVDELLGVWLQRFGRGRELFEAAEALGPTTEEISAG